MTLRKTRSGHSVTVCSGGVGSPKEQPEPPGGQAVLLQIGLQELGVEEVIYEIH